IKCSRAAARCCVLPITSLRCTVCISSRSKTCEYGGGDLSVFFLSDEHFIGDDLHRIIRAGDVLCCFNLCHAEIDRRSAEIVDADDKHWPTLSLQSSRGRTNEYERVFLARN